MKDKVVTLTSRYALQAFFVVWAIVVCMLYINHLLCRGGVCLHLP